MSKAMNLIECIELNIKDIHNVLGDESCAEQVIKSVEVNLSLLKDETNEMEVSLKYLKKRCNTEQKEESDETVSNSLNTN